MYPTNYKKTDTYYFIFIKLMLLHNTKLNYILVRSYCLNYDLRDFKVFLKFPFPEGVAGEA